MVDEARLEQRDAGLTPVTEGWFVVNVVDAAWVQNEELGAACIFEGGEGAFPDLGYTIAVLEPGQSGGRYHREAETTVPREAYASFPQWQPGRPPATTPLFE